MVRQPTLGPQRGHQHGRKAAAKKRVCELHLGASRIIDSDADVTHEEVGLCRAGLVDQQDAATGDSIHCFYRRQRPRGSSPAAEHFRQLRAHCGHVEIPHDSEDQAVTTEVIIVVLHERAVRDPGQ